MTLSLEVEQFLQGPVMSHLAQMQNDCDPAGIIRDYLPPEVDADDDEELMQAVGEACMLAVGVDHLRAVTAVDYAVNTDVVVETPFPGDEVGGSVVYVALHRAPGGWRRQKASRK